MLQVLPIPIITLSKPSTVSIPLFLVDIMTKNLASALKPRLINKNQDVTHITTCMSAINFPDDDLWAYLVIVFGNWY